MFLQKATAKHERLVTLHIGSRHIQQSCSPVGELGVYRTDHYKEQKKSISLLIADTGYHYPCTSLPAPLQRCSGNGSPKRTVFPQIFVEICSFLTRAGQMPIGEPSAPAIPAAVMISHPGMKGTFTFIFVTLFMDSTMCSIV